MAMSGRERQKRWRERNPERFREIRKAHDRKYKEENGCSRYTMRYRCLGKSSLPEFLFRQARDRAKKKDIPFDLTPEDIKIPEVCPVFGIPFVIGEPLSGRRGPHPQAPSVDRVIPSLGYVKENIRIISYRANFIKTNATLSELEMVAAYVRDAIVAK